MEAYDEGLRYIEIIRRARININSLNNLIEQLRIKIMNEPENDELKRNLKDSMHDLIVYQHEEEVHRNAMVTLESKIDHDFYILLLQNLGYTLADTTPIVHVSDAITANDYLETAISSTIAAIRVKNYELSQLPEDDYIHREIVKSELKHFREDVSLHPQGAEYLKELDDENRDRGVLL